MVVNCGSTERRFALLSQWYVTSAALAVLYGLGMGHHRERYRQQLESFLEALQAQIAAYEHPEHTDSTETTDLAEVLLEYQEASGQEALARPVVVLRELYGRLTTVAVDLPQAGRELADLRVWLTYASRRLEERYYGQNPPQPCTVIG